MVLVWGLAGETDVRATIHLWDKALHAAAWAVFALCCLRATHGGVGPLRAGPAWLAAALALAYGGLDEWHQLSIPGREASVGDLLADAVGIVLALAVMALLGPAVAGRRRRGRGAGGDAKRNRDIEWRS